MEANGTFLPQLELAYTSKHWDEAYALLEKECFSQASPTAKEEGALDRSMLDPRAPNPVTSGESLADTSKSALSLDHFFDSFQGALKGPSLQEWKLAWCHYNSGVLAVKQKNLPLARYHWEMASLLGMQSESLHHNLKLAKGLLGANSIEVASWDDRLLNYSKDYLLTPSPLRDWMLALFILGLSLGTFYRQVFLRYQLLKGPLSWQTQRKLNNVAGAPMQQTSKVKLEDHLEEDLEFIESSKSLSKKIASTVFSPLGQFGQMSVGLFKLSSKPLVLSLVLVLLLALQFAQDFMTAFTPGGELGFLTLEKTQVREGPSTLYDARAEVPAGIKVMLGERRAGFVEVQSPYAIKGWVLDSETLGKSLRKKTY